MDATHYEYLDYPKHTPPLIGLYLCKVSATGGYCYMWREWTGEYFNFGPEHTLCVLSWAHYPDIAGDCENALARARCAK